VRAETTIRPRRRAPARLAIYDGRCCIGFLRRYAANVEAFDAAGRSLGIFPSQKLAAAALSTRRRASWV
jgi:hypothetical protein